MAALMPVGGRVVVLAGSGGRRLDGGVLVAQR
ncbi:hypothetical protein AX13_10375 [Comamonas aquatica DA1877]|uniref:Uncharacterized protein n=1 Tax=Comamonas aquatica DA1877 TaxID=1457173 RepID=A0A014P5I0_9BURK|nr:hypothetical protein AX13_10375 [Comamonas aquatica DA1877]